MNSHEKINEQITNLFEEDYYENGIEKKLSGYTNYSWMPTRSISEAIDIKNNFTFNSCVDIGCAKGFLVHALRILNCSAYGEDISDYAVKNSHPKVKDFISKPNDKKYDLVICKDVLEHVDEKVIKEFLSFLKDKGDTFFFVIPLADDGKFRIREYEMDITHVTKKDEEWWLSLFKECGFVLDKFSYSFGSIKNKWVTTFPHGNGFFILKK